MKGDLRRRFDSIILGAQTAQSILHGTRSGEYTSDRANRGEERLLSITVQRPQYTGGIELDGLANLQKFVREGGTLIALDTATELPIQFFPLSVRNVVRSASAEDTVSTAPQFYAPGSLLRVNVETAHPLAFGMPKEAIVFSSGGEAFEFTMGPEFNTGAQEIKAVASFARSDLLASGWVSGANVVHGKHALVEARHGRGRVVLFGFRPQFRGQSFGTFKFLLNAIYMGSAQPL